MFRRSDLSSVLIIGSGPIVIGQACEFDYSGAQACRVLKEESLYVIFANSSLVAIMTNPDITDATYVKLIAPEVVVSVIEKERPDALLSTLGDQMVLNTAVALFETDVLERFNIELTGAPIDAIRAGEDREEFKEIVEHPGTEVARSLIAHTVEEYRTAAAELSYPLIVRPSFTMGGLGSGFAYTPDDLERIAGQDLAVPIATKVLFEESIPSRKGYELELMRDKVDNTVVVCSTKNVDLVDAYTGNSITVTPALILTDREMRRLCGIGVAIIRAVGVDTGGRNIQFMTHPEIGHIVAVEMNPHVSRSSTLASKATGFPTVRITARLATGYMLDEIPNDITDSTPASFGLTLDYVVVRILRFTFEKFPAADPTLTISMKAMGEAMAIGRSYTETLQKAPRSIDRGGVQFRQDGDAPTPEETHALVGVAAVGTESHLVQVQQAIHGGVTLEELFESMKIDPWFLDQLFLLDGVATCTREAEAFTGDILAKAKRHGFSNRQIAAMYGLSEDTVREVRDAFSIHPMFKMVSIYAAEFAVRTPYRYSTYDQENEIRSRGHEAVTILGIGPNHTGRRVELDYSCVHAAMSLREHYKTVMVNCNPEVVLTDYGIPGRLHFEPLTLEDVLEIYRAECAAGPVKGMIAQFGGQTPLSLAADLEHAEVLILGTSSRAIDLAKDREELDKALEAAQCPAPAHDTTSTPEQIIVVAEQAGYPALIRPSFVLGGRGMAITNDESALHEYFVDRSSELLLLRGLFLTDRFLDAAIEIDVDALYDGEELFIGAITEYIEEADIHSGDSSCMLPPMMLLARELERIMASIGAIARGVGMRSLINIQFALLSDAPYVIETNPRASHTVPFASKAIGVQLVKTTALIQVGVTIVSLHEEGLLPTHSAREIHDDDSIAVRVTILPFKHFRTADGEIVDTVPGPEMHSMGEVMDIDRGFPAAFAKSQLGAPTDMPTSGTVFISIANTDKRAIALPAARTHEMGSSILATSGTAPALRRNDIETQAVREPFEDRGGGGESTVVGLINDGSIDMVVNTSQRNAPCNDGCQIRAAVASWDRPAVITLQTFNAMVQAIEVCMRRVCSVYSLQERDSIRSEETR